MKFFTVVSRDTTFGHALSGGWRECATYGSRRKLAAESDLPKYGPSARILEIESNTWPTNAQIEAALVTVSDS